MICSITRLEGGKVGFSRCIFLFSSSNEFGSAGRGVGLVPRIFFFFFLRFRIRGWRRGSVADIWLRDGTAGHRIPVVEFSHVFARDHRHSETARHRNDAIVDNAFLALFFEITTGGSAFVAKLLLVTEKVPKSIAEITFTRGFEAIFF